MNGMALHGGVRPYGGTFMAFTDYARPAMRLAALMKTPTVFVMTHDSIGLGEDGPTHQPVEHVAISAARRRTRYVFRPADTVETAESLGNRAAPAMQTPIGAVADPTGPAHRADWSTRPRTCPRKAPMFWQTAEGKASGDPDGDRFGSLHRAGRA